MSISPLSRAIDPDIEVGTETQRFEDLAVGPVGTFGRYVITEQELIEFARTYNPVPYHIDPDSAEAAGFGGVIATGWHTAAVMSAIVTEGWLRHVATHAGREVVLRYRRPVRTGDELSVAVEILTLEDGRNADLGNVGFKNSVLTQRSEIVLEARISMLVERRSFQRAQPSAAS